VDDGESSEVGAGPTTLGEAAAQPRGETSYLIYRVVTPDLRTLTAEATFLGFVSGELPASLRPDT
jgi:hypothetical protein